LNFWAEVYAPRVPAIDREAPFTSKDIDCRSAPSPSGIGMVAPSRPGTGWIHSTQWSLPTTAFRPDSEAAQAMNTPESCDPDPQVQALLTAMKAALPSLAELLARADDHWGAEDGIYRYYHHSYKVFRLQDLTTEIVEAFFHARFFLQMAVRYGHDLGYAPSSMPSGWALLLHLYGLR
jgi:hypothetical protein